MIKFHEIVYPLLIFLNVHASKWILTKKDMTLENIYCQKAFHASQISYLWILNSCVFTQFKSLLEKELHILFQDILMAIKKRIIIVSGIRYKSNSWTQWYHEMLKEHITASPPKILLKSMVIFPISVMERLPPKAFANKLDIFVKILIILVGLQVSFVKYLFKMSNYQISH